MPSDADIHVAEDPAAEPVDLRPLARLLIEIARAGAKPPRDAGDAVVRKEGGDA
jgi:hypothetical protein